MRWEGWPRTKNHRAWILFAWSLALSGCHAIPLAGKVDTNAKVAANFQGTVDVHLPSATDPGPMIPVVVRRAAAGCEASRIVIVDVDGLLLNQNLTGIYSVGENPVSAFREKLEMAAGDPRVRGLVLRVHSPGGGVTASDILAEELRRFRQATGKPVVACLMDVATGGAYYLAVGCDRVFALPTSITGGIGALINHANLEDAMAQLNLRVEPVKAGELVDMGSVAAPLSDEARGLFQDMANGFRDRFASRVAQYRPAMTVEDRRSIADGRIVAAPRALRFTWSTNWGMWMMRSPRPRDWQVLRDRKSSSSRGQGIPLDRSTRSFRTSRSRAS